MPTAHPIRRRLPRDAARQPVASRAQLTEADFRRLAALVESTLGIHMGSGKKNLLTARVTKRMRALRLNSLAEYCDFLFGAGREQELPHLIDVVTTKKTDFFRDPQHFTHLVQRALPKLLAGGITTARIWSAACATGEEPYSLAMALADAAARLRFDFEVTATDVSLEALRTAQLGIYPADRVAGVNAGVRRRYVMQSKDRDRPRVRIVPELRARVRFARYNLIADDTPPPGKFDIIFLRNVMIYFPRENQHALLTRMCERLTAQGYLYLGLSETTNGLSLPLVHDAPSVYRHVSGGGAGNRP